MPMPEHQAVAGSADTPGALMRSLGKGEAFALLSILVVGTAARFYHIGWLSLWLDEGFSEWASRQSIWYLWTVLPTFEPHPPLYYTLLKGWRALFGDGEAALRSLSALFGIATIPLVFAMGRMLGGRRHGTVVGLAAAAMFAISPIHVQYAQEARPYAMLTFSVALAMTGAMWLMLNPARLCALVNQPPPLRGGSLFGMLGLFALGLAMILWSHNTGPVAVLAIVLPGIYWWLADASRCPRALVRLLVACALAFALYLPNLGPLFGHIGHVSTSFWIRAPGWADITTTITRLFGAPTRVGFVAFVTFWTLAVYGMICLWQRGMRSVALLLVSTALFPIVAELLVSYLAMPVFLERTLIYVNIPLYIAAAYGIARIPMTLWKAIGLTVVAALLVASLVSHFRVFRKEPWHDIAAYLVRTLQPGQPVLLVPAWVSPVLDYYVVRQGGTLRQIGVPANWPEPSRSFPTPDAVPGRKVIEIADMRRINQIIEGNKTVGLIMRRVDLYDAQILVKKEISKTFNISESRQFGSITVIIFTPWRGPERYSEN